MKIIPPGMTFGKALRLGYVGEMRQPGYLAWIRTLPCHRCHAPAPSDPSHPNFYKSQKRKAPDVLALPECRRCHEDYERIGKPDEEVRLARASVYMLQAIYEGRLKWVGEGKVYQPGASLNDRGAPHTENGNGQTPHHHGAVPRHAER